MNYCDAMKFKNSKEEEEDKTPTSWPKIANTLIWCSSIEDNLAIRNADSGSWFIQHACKEMMSNPEQGMDVTMKKVTSKAIDEDPKWLWTKNGGKDGKGVQTYPVPCITHDTRRADIRFKNVVGKKIM